MTSHAELVAAIGAEVCEEMARVAEALVAHRPRRSSTIAELTAIVATHPSVIDATIDELGGAHIRFDDSTVLHAQIDRGVIGMLVDPALRFSVGGFWEEGDGWILGWQSSDGSVFVQTTVPAVHITRHDNQPG